MVKQQIQRIGKALVPQTPKKEEKQKSKKKRVATTIGIVGSNKNKITITLKKKKEPKKDIPFRPVGVSIPGVVSAEQSVRKQFQPFQPKGIRPQVKPLTSLQRKVINKRAARNRPIELSGTIFNDIASVFSAAQMKKETVEDLDDMFAEGLTVHDLSITDTFINPFDVIPDRGDLLI